MWEREGESEVEKENLQFKFIVRDEERQSHEENKGE